MTRYSVGYSQGNPNAGKQGTVAVAGNVVTFTWTLPESSSWWTSCRIDSFVQFPETVTPASIVGQVTLKTGTANLKSSGTLNRNWTRQGVTSGRYYSYTDLDVELDETDTDTTMTLTCSFVAGTPLAEGWHVAVLEFVPAHAQDNPVTLPAIGDVQSVEENSITIDLPAPTGTVDTPVSYQLYGKPTGMTLQQRTSGTLPTWRLTGTPTNRGTYPMIWQCVDADGDYDQSFFTLTVVRDLTNVGEDATAPTLDYQLPTTVNLYEGEYIDIFMPRGDGTRPLALALDGHSGATQHGRVFSRLNQDLTGVTTISNTKLPKGLYMTRGTFVTQHTTLPELATSGWYVRITGTPTGAINADGNLVLNNGTVIQSATWTATWGVTNTSGSAQTTMDLVVHQARTTAREGLTLAWRDTTKRGNIVLNAGQTYPAGVPDLLDMDITISGGTRPYTITADRDLVNLFPSIIGSLGMKRHIDPREGGILPDRNNDRTQRVYARPGRRRQHADNFHLHGGGRQRIDRDHSGAVYHPATVRGDIR